MRKERRYAEMVAKGQQVDLQQLQADIAERDKQDSERAISPLRQADICFWIHPIGISEVTERILQLVQERAQ